MSSNHCFHLKSLHVAFVVHKQMIRSINSIIELSFDQLSRFRTRIRIFSLGRSLIILHFARFDLLHFVLFGQLIKRLPFTIEMMNLHLCETTQNQASEHEVTFILCCLQITQRFGPSANLDWCAIFILSTLGFARRPFFHLIKLANHYRDCDFMLFLLASPTRLTFSILSFLIHWEED